MEKIKGFESIAFLIGLTLIIVGLAVIVDTWSYTQGNIDDFSIAEENNAFVDNKITQEFDCSKGDKITGEIKSLKIKSEDEDEKKYPFNIYILDKENFEKYPQREGLEYAFVKENVEEIEFDEEIPKEGKWYVVIDNTEVITGAKEGEIDLSVEYYVKRESNYRYLPIIIGVVFVGIAVYLKFFSDNYDEYE